MRSPCSFLRLCLIKQLVFQLPVLYAALYSCRRKQAGVAAALYQLFGFLPLTYRAGLLFHCHILKSHRFIKEPVLLCFSPKPIARPLRSRPASTYLRPAEATLCRCRPHLLRRLSGPYSMNFAWQSLLSEHLSIFEATCDRGDRLRQKNTFAKYILLPGVFSGGSIGSFLPSSPKPFWSYLYTASVIV